MTTPELSQLFNVLRASSMPLLAKQFIQVSGYGSIQFDHLVPLADAAREDSLIQEEIERLRALIPGAVTGLLSLNEKAGVYMADKIRPYVEIAEMIDDWLTNANGKTIDVLVSLATFQIPFTEDDAPALTSERPIEPEEIVVGPTKNVPERPIEMFARWLGIELIYVDPEWNAEIFQYRILFNDAISVLRSWSREVSLLAEPVQSFNSTLAADIKINGKRSEVTQESTDETLQLTVSKQPTRYSSLFTSRLMNGFTESDLVGLLKEVGFIDEEGDTLKFTAYLMHQVLDVLIDKQYYRGDTNRERDQKALQRYLGLKETRVTVEHGSPKKSVNKRVLTYLTKWENQRKING